MAVGRATIAKTEVTEIGSAAPRPVGTANPLVLGPVLVDEQWLPPGGYLHMRPEGSEGAGLLACQFIRAGKLAWHEPAGLGKFSAGSAILLDIDKRWSFSVSETVHAVTLVAPRAMLAPLGTRNGLTGALANPAALAAVEHFLLDALTLEREHLSVAAGRFFALALADLLAATAAPTQHGLSLLARQRGSTLLDRAVDHIDAHLGDALGAAQLCQALGCSRSTLYRAVAPAGGVDELVTRRRLSAVYRRLRDPEEARYIAQLAADHGFPNASQFSRRFRHAFGDTAGSVRARNGVRSERPTDLSRPLVDLLQLASLP